MSPTDPAASVRALAQRRVSELQRAGWLDGASAARIERVTEASVRDALRRSVPEHGALERDLLILDPRTRNAALPQSLTGDPFDVMLPSPEGGVFTVRTTVTLPDEGAGVSTWTFDWAGAPRRLALCVHDGLYNRGLALRGLNKFLAAQALPWRFSELLACAVPVVVLTEPDPLRRLLALDWVTELPAAGIEDDSTRSALVRAQDLQEAGAAHAALPADLVRRAFSGPRRFKDELADDMIGNHVLVLDGLRCFHLDLVRPFDSERHQALLEGLFRIGCGLFDGAEVTDLDSTPTEEGPTELDFEWGDDEYRITFEQEFGVIEVGLIRALNGLLAEHGHERRFVGLAPVTDQLLVVMMSPDELAKVRSNRLVRLSEASFEPGAGPADRRARVEVL